jgi:hypothetical protein
MMAFLAIIITIQLCLGLVLAAAVPSLSQHGCHSLERVPMPEVPDSLHQRSAVASGKAPESGRYADLEDLSLKNENGFIYVRRFCFVGKIMFLTSGHTEDVLSSAIARGTRLHRPCSGASELAIAENHL